MAAFAAFGRVDDWGRSLSGSDEVRSWADTDAIGQSARMDVTTAAAEGEVTSLEFGWSSNRFNGESTAYVSVRDDLVAELRIPPH